MTTCQHVNSDTDFLAKVLLVTSKKQGRKIYKPMRSNQGDCEKVSWPTWRPSVQLGAQRVLEGAERVQGHAAVTRTW